MLFPLAHAGYPEHEIKWENTFAAMLLQCYRDIQNFQESLFIHPRANNHVLILVGKEINAAIPPRLITFKRKPLRQGCVRKLVRNILNKPLCIPLQYVMLANPIGRFPGPITKTCINPFLFGHDNLLPLNGDPKKVA